MTKYDVLAGTLIAAHGVQGAVKIRLATRTALALLGLADGVARRPVDVWLGAGSKAADGDDAQGQVATITSVKELRPNGTVYLVKIAGIRDRTAAEALIGRPVYAPADRRAPLSAQEYFTEDLIGLEVVANNGRRYGKITAVLSEPANDVYETDTGALIPAVAQFVRSVDLVARTLTVTDIAGLQPEEAEEVAPGDERVEALGTVESSVAAGTR